jgi:hypothetical protein
MAGNPTLPVHQTREGSGTHGKNSGKGRATRLPPAEAEGCYLGYAFASLRAESRLL